MRGVAWLAVCIWLGVGGSSWAYYLDKGRNFDVRFRGYSQLSVSAEKSRDVNPQFDPGDIFGQRNFYNPEFDARLTDYMGWMNNVRGLSLIAPDDFKFRFAWWGFYDGLYDYGAPQWNQARNGILKGAARQRYATLTAAQGGIKGSGADPSLGPMARQSQSDDIRKESFNFTDENRNLNGILRHRNRINEMYLDYTSGRVFVRAGRQAISWGESDSIAQLDVSNPFDLTQTAPGFFQDVDEARIPLWTLRSTIKLIDSWKELSSLFVDTYLVPGVIDTTVPITPSWFGQPGSQAGYDPHQATLFNPKLVGIPSNLHVSIVDQLPENNMGNSRWGARLTGVVARDYTVQGWFFRTFNQQPVPQLVGTNPNGQSVLMDNRGFRVSSCVNADGTPVVPQGKTGPKVGHTAGGRACMYAFPLVTVLHHRLESVAGVSSTWFSQPVNGIIRTEFEYFKDEPSVIPTTSNLNPLNTPNSVPKADYLRFIFGYDTFFFVRWLNPTNSFTFVTQYQGSLNTTSLIQGTDFRTPQVKPGGAQQCAGPNLRIDDSGREHFDPACTTTGSAPGKKAYEDQHTYEHFLTMRLQTDYMHGRLSPGMTVILDPSGIFGFQPGVTFRINDNLLASTNFYAVEGSRRTGLATFRDRDQFQFRLTYQLN